ncbi:MAG TPA: hypothetical protein VHN82_02910 [Methanoregula sp.]|nr:hypothetical protein [Methanoregula sp.]
MSRRTILILAVVLSLLFLAGTATAISIKHVDAIVSDNGDTLFTADYTLQWAERAIAYPAAVPLIQGYPKKDVQILSVTPERAQVVVQHLVTVQQLPDARKYITPGFSLANAKSELNKYWFGSMITLDGAAGSLSIHFPDGAIIEHKDLTTVPSFEHVSGGL